MDAVRRDYDFFQQLFLAWFQGTLTRQEIFSQIEDIFPPRAFQASSGSFIHDLEEALEDYQPAFHRAWQRYKETATDTAPTLAGLQHNLHASIQAQQPIGDLLDWACWHNVDDGETTAGQFENENVEYYCRIFLPGLASLNPAFLAQTLPIVERALSLSFELFALKLHLLVAKARKNLHFFFKDYLEGKKNDQELREYFNKQCPHPRPDQYFNPLKLDMLAPAKRQQLHVEFLLDQIAKV